MWWGQSWAPSNPGTVLLALLCLLDTGSIWRSIRDQTIQVDYSGRIFQASENPSNMGCSQAERPQEGWRVRQLLTCGSSRAAGRGPWVGPGVDRDNMTTAGRFQFPATVRLTVNLPRLCEHLGGGQAPLEVLLFTVIAHCNPSPFNAELEFCPQRKTLFLSSWRHSIVAAGIISKKRQQIAIGLIVFFLRALYSRWYITGIFKCSLTNY